jgi:hypothetical protein
MRDAKLSAGCMAACSMSAYVLRCRFRASGVEGAGMARGRGELLARSWGRAWVVDVEVGVDALAGLLAQLARAFAARGGFPSESAMEARSSRTARYSSASLASSSRAWASCALMSALHGGEVGAHLARALVWSNSGIEGDLSVASFRRVRGVCLVVGDHDEALPRGVVAPDAGVVGVAEPVVRGVEEPLEHHRVQYAVEVPLRVPV